MHVEVCVGRVGEHKVCACVSGGRVPCVCRGKSEVWTCVHVCT